MAYSDDDKRRVLDAVDFVALVGEQVALKRVGRRWVGICPFHSEDSPSLSVNAEQGLYYCFGCHAAGDSITFVQNVYRLDFTEALEYLSARTGVRMTPIAKGEVESRGKRERLLKVLAKAAEHFRATFEDPLIGDPARTYLKARGISEESIKHFSIGFAPERGRPLAEIVGATSAELVDAGLGYLDDSSRLKEHFRGRVMFPIDDASGRVIGFGGRILPEIASSAPKSVTLAKYKNSPETDVYQKRRTLYGLDLARAEIVSSNELVVCEGYTDVIGFWQSGVRNAVATCGTALTEEHFDRIRNFAKRVVLAFDADGAGQDAAERFYQMERRHSISIFVAKLPPGKDPGELASENPELLKAAIHDAMPFLSFRLNRLFGRADLKSAEGRARAADEALSLLSQHPNPLVRSDYLGVIADRTKTRLSDLRLKVDRAPVNRVGRGVMSPSGGVGSPLDSNSKPENAPSPAAIEAMRLLVHDPSVYIDIIRPQLFRSQTLASLAEFLETVQDTAAASQAFRDSAGEPGATFFRLASEPPSMDPLDIVSTLAVQEANHELALLSQALKGELPPEGMTELARTISRMRNLIEELSSSEQDGEAVGELITWLIQRRTEAL